MTKIKNIKAREILDSRGDPTVEVELKTENGLFLSSVPSGASVGKHETKELRDGGERYRGKGVLKAIKNIEEIIAPQLKGLEVSNQKKIDETLIALDGTKDKSNLGANAILPVSIAICRAGAVAKNISLYQYIFKLTKKLNLTSANLPVPCFNIINGGLHAGNDLDFQEFMVVPACIGYARSHRYAKRCGRAEGIAGRPQFNNFTKNLQAGSEIYHTLKEILKRDFGENAINVGDEGGFSPNLSTAEQALDLIMKAIKASGYENKVSIALDVAASEFYENFIKNKISNPVREKFLNGADGAGGKYGARSRNEMVEYYLELIEKYPITSIEDPFDQDDFEGFSILMNKCGDKIDIVGDDLLVTNIERIKEAQEKKACNSLLLKVNQIGTVTEVIEAAKLAQSYNWKIMVSHRSGETTDDFIADLAVGIGAEYIKSGAPARGERVAKYNRLLKIEQELKGV